jgi:uncharacterized coiled-coil DUF342 family protein
MPRAKSNTDLLLEIQDLKNQLLTSKEIITSMKEEAKEIREEIVVTRKEVDKLKESLINLQQIVAVLKIEFKPMQSILYGFIGLILVAVITAIVAGVIK